MPGNAEVSLSGEPSTDQPGAEGGQQPTEAYEKGAALINEFLMAQDRGPQALYVWLEAVMAKGRWCHLPERLEVVIKRTLRKLVVLTHPDKNHEDLKKTADIIFKKNGQWQEWFLLAYENSLHLQVHLAVNRRKK